MSRWNLAWLAGLTAAGLIGLSMYLTLPTPASTLQKKHENYKLVVDVLEEVQKKYAKELTPDEARKLIEDMINGGLSQLDDHSYFYNKESYKEFEVQSKGRFAGVGIQLGLNKFKQLYVIAPIFDSPAHKAGIQAGDVILKIDDKSTEKMVIEEARRLIIGEIPTKVRLTVQHKGDKKPQEVEITRGEITVESVLGDRRVNLKDWEFMIDDKLKIAYVRVTDFKEKTTEEMVKVLGALETLGMQGLVLDLRDNPGGLLKAAVDLASLFLPEGKPVVTTKGRTKDDEQAFNAAIPPKAVGFKPQTRYPIAILINRGSASASEILAAALQDHLRGIVIGERSFGKGSVQTLILMEHETTALKITNAIYWRPSGRNIHRFKPSHWEEDDPGEWGVLPDKGLRVKVSDEEYRDWLLWRRDRDRGEGPDKKEGAKEGKGEFAPDKVLEKALEHLRGELSKIADVRPVMAPDAAPVRAALPEVLPGTRADARPARALLNREPLVR